MNALEDESQEPECQKSKIVTSIEAPAEMQSDIKPYLRRLLTIYYEVKEVKMSQAGL